MDISFNSTDRDRYAFNRKTEGLNALQKEPRDALILECLVDGAEYAIQTGVTTFGIGEYCDVIYNGTGLGISNIHCIFEIPDSGYPVFVEDVDSTNGTEVESRFAPASAKAGTSFFPLVSKRLYQLLDGDTLQLADTLFKVKILACVDSRMLRGKGNSVGTEISDSEILVNVLESRNLLKDMQVEDDGAEAVCKSLHENVSADPAALEQDEEEIESSRIMAMDESDTEQQRASPDLGLEASFAAVQNSPQLVDDCGDMEEVSSKATDDHEEIIGDLTAGAPESVPASLILETESPERKQSPPVSRSDKGLLRRESINVVECTAAEDYVIPTLGTNDTDNAVLTRDALNEKETNGEEKEADGKEKEVASLEPVLEEPSSSKNGPKTLYSRKKVVQDASHLEDSDVVRDVDSRLEDVGENKLEHSAVEDTAEPPASNRSKAAKGLSKKVTSKPTKKRKAEATPKENKRVKPEDAVVDSFATRPVRSSRSRREVNYAPPPLDPFQDPAIVGRSVPDVTENQAPAEEAIISPIPNAKVKQDENDEQEANLQNVLEKEKVKGKSSRRRVKSNAKIAVDSYSESTKSTPSARSKHDPVEKDELASSALVSQALGPGKADVEKNVAAFRVVFTGKGEDVIKKQGAILQSLDAEIVDSWKDCTHLIADKVRRTVKFLCAFAAGKHIYSPSWINACKKSGVLLEDDSFQLKDKAAEATYDFNLGESLQKVRTREKLLCDGIRFLATKSVVPGKSDLNEIITAAGGFLHSTR